MGSNGEAIGKQSERNGEARRSDWKQWGPMDSDWKTKESYGKGAGGYGSLWEDMGSNEKQSRK